MSKRSELQRRSSGLRKSNGDLDPNVEKARRQAEKALAGKGAAKEKLVNVYVRLPESLYQAISHEAHALSGHERRGVQGLITVLLRYGWQAYQDGTLKLELVPRTVQVDFALQGEE